MNLKIWISAAIATVCLASHGQFRSCYQCAEDNADNYFCDWGKTLDWNVVCCEPDSKSPYCQQTAKNKCFPSQKIAGPMYFANCPKVDKTMCDKSTPKTLKDDMKLLAKTDKQTFKIENLLYQNETDKTNKPDQFDACYYIIETSKDLYKAGTLKIKFQKEGIDNFHILSGETVDKAVAGKAECDAIKQECKINFDQVFVLVALPNKNTPTNSLTFDYILENVEDTDWYRRFYVENFTGEDG
jgi:hypothetical protein